ncbi:MAG: extracellular solute-binding protein [Firmicutes bacterium]|nr:extracellular solute-binding protein [Bacillota bacterium]
MRKIVMLLVISALVWSFAIPALAAESITFWQFGSQTPKTTNFAKQMTADFKAQTGIDVNWEIVSWGDSWNRLTLAVTSGNAPDVSMVGATWVGYFMATGAVLNLSPYLDQIGGSKKFLLGAWESAGMKGNIIAPPWDADTRGMLYRKDIFEKLGLKPPRTWADLVKVAKEIQKKTGMQYPVAITGKDWEVVHNFVTFAYAGGGRLVSEDGKRALLDSPEVLESVGFWVDLITKEKVMSPSVMTLKGDDIAQRFINGDTAIIFSPVQGVEGQAKDGKFAYKDKWDMAPFPTKSAKIPQFSVVLPDNVMIFANTKHKEAALKFVKFLFSRDQETLFATTYAIPPTTFEAFETPAFQTTYWQDVKKLMEIGRFVPIMPAWGDAETIIQQAMTNVFSNVADNKYDAQVLKRTMQSANKQFQEAIDRAVK